MGGKFHFPATFPLCKEPLVQIKQGQSGPQARSRPFEEDKKTSFPPINLMTLPRPCLTHSLLLDRLDCFCISQFYYNCLGFIHSDSEEVEKSSIYCTDVRNKQLCILIRELIGALNATRQTHSRLPEQQIRFHFFHSHENVIEI